MKIAFDIGHPAYYWFFRKLILFLNENRHEIFITIHNKDILNDLIKADNLSFILFPKPQKHIARIINAFKIIFFLKNYYAKIKPDIVLGFSPYAAISARLNNIPNWTFEDTEPSSLDHVIFKLTSTKIYTPSCFKKQLGKKQVFFNGFKELAYLHPEIFTPDNNVLSGIGVSPNEPYSIIRFVSWTARHDKGHKGLTYRNKIIAIEEFKKYGKVFISSEEALPPELKPYKLTIPPEKLHSVIAFASLVFGESSTLAAEAAVLGVPAIYIDNTGRGYTHELSTKYNLLFNFNETEEGQRLAILQGKKILSENRTEEFKLKQQHMLQEKDNIYNFLLTQLKEKK